MKRIIETINNTKRWLGVVFIILSLLLLIIYLNNEKLQSYVTIQINLPGDPHLSLVLFTIFLCVLIGMIYQFFNWRLMASGLAMAFTQGAVIVKNYWADKTILYDRLGLKITRNWTEEELIGFIEETIQSFKSQLSNYEINVQSILSEIDPLKEKEAICNKIKEIITEKYLTQPEVVSNGILDTINNHPLLTICVMAVIAGILFFLVSKGQKIDPKDGEYVEPPIDPKKIITEPDPEIFPWDDPTDTIDFPPRIKATEEYAPNIMGIGCWERKQDVAWADNGVLNRIEQLDQEIGIIKQCVFHLDQEGKIGTGERVSWEIAKDLIGSYLESKGIESTRVSNLMIGLRGKAGAINTTMGYLMKLLDWRNEEYFYFKKWKRF